MKGVFLCVPSVSVAKTLTPVVDEISANGCEVIYYNASEFEPDGDYHFLFRAYPERFAGYFAGKMDADTSYFDFGEILLDSALDLIDFLISEFNVEKPDFVMYSHLAVWGKLMAQRYKIPSITLYTTFVLDKRVMLPFLRKINEGNQVSFNHVSDALNFYRKWSNLYTCLQMEGRQDIWDIYINKGDLNLSFILESFQHERHLFGEEFHFLGYPALCETTEKRTCIYVSMGTVFTANPAIYQLCIDVLGEIEIPSIVSIGTKGKCVNFKHISKHIAVKEFVEQREVLQSAKLFITGGGMASVHEAIYSCTPMIVIPTIPEQQLTAEAIARLNLGMHIQQPLVTRHVLKQAILEVLSHHDVYVENIRRVCTSIPATPPEKRARQLISNFLIGQQLNPSSGFGFGC